MREVTMRDVADAAAVTPAVVSRVNSGDTTLRISKETRARVLAAISDLDFQPNTAARSLRSSRSGLIAVVVQDVSNAVYAEIIRGLQSGASKANMAILLADCESVQSSEARLSELVGGGGVDGLILQAGNSVPARLLARAGRKDMPIVLLQAQLDLRARLVVLPDAAAARLATEHLLLQGHRNIACVATASGLSFTSARLEGWRAALAGADASAVADNVFYAAQSDVAEGHRAAERLLAAHPSVTGIVCFNPLLAVGVMQCIEEMGLAVPTDVSVISVHDLSYANHLRVPLTTIATPLFEMGEQAVAVLMDSDLPPDYRTQISGSAVRLIQRESTSTPKPRTVHVLPVYE